MKNSKKTVRNSSMNPWTWIPSLYFTQGIPYVVAMTVAVIMYKRFGISNADIALYTSWLYLPWVIKPFWSPFVDILKNKRWWIVTMQMLIGGGLATMVFCINGPYYFQLSLSLLWLIAFSSATHDIAADGFYMIELNDSQQSFYVGIRNLFYRLSMISGQGLLVVIAGYFEKRILDIHLAWSYTFLLLGVLYLLLFVYHKYKLPNPEKTGLTKRKNVSEVAKDCFHTFTAFFKKDNIYIALTFMLLYRLGEALLAKMVSPFLLDDRNVGGLGLSTQEVGIVYGTVGVISLALGGIVGGILVSKHGLKFWLWPMAFSITLPHLAFLFLSWVTPTNILIINFAVGVEQFGYGFGFTAYMLYLIYFSQGENKTAHYAICTGFMALGMMIPGMVAGKLQEWLGYKDFFTLVMICAIPTLAIIPFIKIESAFGKKKLNS
jgi:MFS transporter, PAT family, beta-lactamase induction signal transducer AmpG